MIFQGTQSSQDRRVTARQTIPDMLTVHRIGSKPQIAENDGELTDLVHLPSLLAGSQPRSPLGIQRQSKGRACALAAAPPVRISDEAVCAMDVSVQPAVLNLLVELSCELNFYTLISSAHLTVVRRPLSSAWVRSSKHLGVISSSRDCPTQRRRPQAARSFIDARRSFEFCASQNAELNTVHNRSSIGGGQQVACHNPLVAMKKEK